MSSLSLSVPFGLNTIYSFLSSPNQQVNADGLGLFVLQNQSQPSSTRLIPSSLNFTKVDANLSTTSPFIMAKSLDSGQKSKPVFAADMPKTPEVAAEVYGNNMEGLKGVILEKLAQIDTPLYQDDPIAQTRLLLDAYDTVGAFLAAIQKDAGDNPSPQLKSLIQQIEALQDLVLQKFKSILGVDITQDELKALLDNNPKSKQNQDKTKLLNAQDPKTKTLLGSASQKLTKQLDTITEQASQFLAQAEANPAQAPMLIIQAMLLLRQGVQITMIAGALENLGNNQQATPQQQAAGGSGNYLQAKQKLMTLLTKAIQLSKANGIGAEKLIPQTELGSTVAA